MIEEVMTETTTILEEPNLKTSTYTGKEHQWGLNPKTRMNPKLLALAPTIGVLTTTILFNKSSYALPMYTWLNANFTPFQINTYVGFALTSGVYWAGGLIYMALDLWEPLRSRVESYKLQPGSRVTGADYRKVCLIVLRNQLLVALPLHAATGYFAPLRTTMPLPGAWESIGTYIFCLLVEEIGFYAVHRSFHHPKLYKHIHKMHHKFTAPVALSSTYCTLFEHCFSNILPIIFGVWILRSHWSMMIMFFCGLELGTLSTHSGYNFPGGFNALHHDFHHYSFTENFAPLGLLDQFLGTNTTFKAWLKELGRRDDEAETDFVSRARKELNDMEIKRDL